MWYASNQTSCAADDNNEDADEHADEDDNEVKRSSLRDSGKVEHVIHRGAPQSL